MSSNDGCCTKCGESCGESCAESCSNSCKESCQESCDCNKICSDCCSRACNQCCEQNCGTNSTAFVIPSSGIFLTTTVGFLSGFYVQGPIIITLLGSILLAINLTGFRGYYKHFNPTNFRSNSYFLIRNKVLIVHSHHTEDDIKRGKEFSLGNRYFCTGCYGLLAGTCLAIAIFISYLAFHQTFNFPSFYLWFIPLFFLPIVLRYTVMKRMPSTYRFLSNMLVPTGCSLLFILLDNLFRSWMLNALVVVFILMVALLRGIISSRG